MLSIVKDVIDCILPLSGKVYPKTAVLQGQFSMVNQISLAEKDKMR